MPKTTLKDLQEEIDKIKTGYKEIAKVIGETRGELSNFKQDYVAHSQTPDAHNPAVLVKKKNGIKPH